VIYFIDREAAVDAVYELLASWECANEPPLYSREECGEIVDAVLSAKQQCFVEPQGLSDLTNLRHDLT
jgi:hypothetical protein